jgi:DNA-binding transcriptional regulator YhcF (GntR family)
VVSLKVVLDKDWVELIAAAKAMGLTKEEVLDFIRRKNQRREA